MPAIDFQKRFAPLIESGEKTQTIRRTPKAKPGQTLFLYTGQRTKACRKIGEVTCTSVRKIRISEIDITIDDKPIATIAVNYFAQRDGFKDFNEMKDFFKQFYGSLPFNGYLTEWKR